MPPWGVYIPHFGQISIKISVLGVMYPYRWHGGGDSRSPPPCHISPHRCNSKGVQPPKLKFLFRFDRNEENKRPTGAYPLRDFHKICRVHTPFQDTLAVKIWLDLLEGLWSYGGFKLRGSGFAQIFSVP